MGDSKMKNVLRMIFIVVICVVSVFVQECFKNKFDVCSLNVEALAEYEVDFAIACVEDVGECCFYDSYILQDYDEREVGE